MLRGLRVQVCLSEDIVKLRIGSRGTELLRLSRGAPSMGYILASRGEPPVPPLYSSSTASIKTSDAMINVRTAPEENGITTSSRIPTIP